MIFLKVMGTFIRFQRHLSRDLTNRAQLTYVFPRLSNLQKENLFKSNIKICNLLHDRIHSLFIPITQSQFSREVLLNREIGA